MEITQNERKERDEFTVALGLIAELAEQRNEEHDAFSETTSKLRTAVVDAVRKGFLSEAEAARHADVDRMTVRKWLGKR
jgi:hypothetical protein